MFRAKLFAVILVLSALLFSCSGKDGATGPAGPAGTAGTDGNANVILFQFGSQTSTTGLFSYPFAATASLVDTSIILGYYMESGWPNWYIVPGLGPGADYATRSYWRYNSNNCLYYVQLSTANGTSDYTTSTTFTEFKILIVPASTITALTSRGLNLSDYNAVADYLNLSE
ncbi:MAG: hypothetical protein NTW97_11785 [Candidatus Krumholzibacteria bacterium]|nr:hypothetical protein [Candidatus Krumholzibacteria bacterium]